MKITLNAINKCDMSSASLQKLLIAFGKTRVDDEQLSILAILDSNGFHDAIQCLHAVKNKQRELLLFSVWCARQVQHLANDPRSIAALDVAERFANGQASKEERAAASDEAWAAFAKSRLASKDARRAAASASEGGPIINVTCSAAWAASINAKDTTAGDAAWAAIKAAQEKKLREICDQIAAVEVA